MRSALLVLVAFAPTRLSAAEPVADGWAGGGSVRLHDLKTGRFLAALPSGSRAGVTVAFLPDGRIVTAGETATVWAADAAGKVKPPEKP